METSSLTLKRSFVLSEVIPVAIFVLLMAAASRVVIPLSFTPVPVTMQVFAVILSGLVLGSRKALAVQLSILALIAAGVPFTAYGLSGPLAFVGPTAGYLLAFAPAAYFAGLVAEKSQSKINYIFAGVVGVLVIYLGGTAWLSIYLHNAVAAVKLGVLPFVLVDIIKVAIAVSIAGGMKKAFGKQ